MLLDPKTLHPAEQAGKQKINKQTFVKKLMMDNSLVRSNAGENVLLSIASLIKIY